MNKELLQSVKDEVANKLTKTIYPYSERNFEGLMIHSEYYHEIIPKVYDEIAELYHKRMLKQVKELPDKTTIELKEESLEVYNNQTKKYIRPYYSQGAEWMKEKASILIASLREQLEEKDKEIEELRGGYV